MRRCVRCYMCDVRVGVALALGTPARHTPAFISNGQWFARVCGVCKYSISSQRPDSRVRITGRKLPDRAGTFYLEAYGYCDRT